MTARLTNEQLTGEDQTKKIPSDWREKKKKKHHKLIDFLKKCFILVMLSAAYYDALAVKQAVRIRWKGPWKDG